jgi:hypothetical protein
VPATRAWVFLRRPESIDGDEFLSSGDTFIRRRLARPGVTGVFGAASSPPPWVPPRNRRLHDTDSLSGGGSAGNPPRGTTAAVAHNARARVAHVHTTPARSRQPRPRPRVAAEAAPAPPGTPPVPWSHEEWRGGARAAIVVMVGGP